MNGFYCILLERREVNSGIGEGDVIKGLNNLGSKLEWREIITTKKNPMGNVHSACPA